MSRSWSLAATSLVVLALAGCGSAPAASTGHPADQHVVRVPRVTGLPRSKAVCALVDAGLRWRGPGEQRSHRTGVIPCHKPGYGVAPDPTVRRERPRAGRRVARGATVVLEDDCTLLRFHKPPSACS
jgi:hypothetical protein